MPARIDERTKAEAEAVLVFNRTHGIGAFRMMIMRIAKEKVLPFEPLIPNDETIEAIRAARGGELSKAGPPDRVLEKLNMGD